MWNQTASITLSDSLLNTKDDATPHGNSTGNGTGIFTPDCIVEETHLDIAPRLIQTPNVRHYMCCSNGCESLP